MRIVQYNQYTNLVESENETKTHHCNVKILKFIDLSMKCKNVTSKCESVEYKNSDTKNTYFKHSDVSKKYSSFLINLSATEILLTHFILKCMRMYLYG